MECHEVQEQRSQFTLMLLCLEILFLQLLKLPLAIEQVYDWYRCRLFFWEWKYLSRIIS
jgi:hypothetical protein